MSTRTTLTMIPALFRSFRFPNEFALLLALVFFIPLFEVPKNLLLVAYAATWIGNRYRAGWRQ